MDILNIRLSKWIEDNNLLVDEHNGFRRNKPCIEHIYSLYSVVNKRKLDRQSTFACEITIIVNNAVKSLYNNVKCAVKVNDVIIPFLDVTFGVKQGCRLSPTLFAIYINAEEIKALNCVIEIGDEQLALLLYADDIALLAPTEQSLQLMLNTLHECCIKWRLLINREKNKNYTFQTCSCPKSSI